MRLSFSPCAAFFLITAIALSARAQPAAPPTSRPVVLPMSTPNVLIISIDGLRPDCMLRADAPTLRSLMARGSFTAYARTTDIAITTPSHISMLTGVTPERHGITFNNDPPEDARILVPTIFDFAKNAGMTTGMASGKRKFTLLERTHHIDWSWVTPEIVTDDAPVGEAAVKIITEHKPRLMFVHFPGADTVGHAIGWGTPAQLASIARIDHSISNVLHAYDDAGMTANTYIIVTSDHGGSGRVHGENDAKSRFIPWMIVGPGVRADFDLTRLGKDFDVATFDTFATAMYLLDLPVPSDSDGKPIFAAFNDYDLLTDTAALPATAPMPTTAPTSMPAR